MDPFKGEQNMPVNLSIKNVPDALAERLRQRANEHHRSLQGELLTILEQAVDQDEKLTPGQLLDAVRSMGLETRQESASFLREDRDAR